jgi:hypothetical protein
MSDKRDKELSARIRECFDGACTHLRAGAWHGPAVEAVTSHGSVWDMHGTVCTCCPPKPTTEGDPA